MNLKTGHQLAGGRYRVERVLGQGGFGITYEARDTKFKSRVKSVAIKEFFVKDFCNREQETNRIIVATQSKVELVEKLRNKFIDEANALFELEHPGIVRVTDTFEENGTAYYVMEYINGSSLSTIIETEGPLNENKALGYIRQAASALEYLHGHNRLHLDIKPQNMMVDNDGRVVLIDFGVSKQYDEVKGENTSTLLGSTPGYAPIEQSGNGVSEFYPSTDIYSLGATLYKLLTGNTPLPAHQLASGEMLLPLPHSVSATTRKAVESAMSLNRNNRPQSIGEFLSLLECHSEQSEESQSGEDNGETLIGGSNEEGKKHPGGNVPKPPFNDFLFIISVVAVCIIAVLVGINDRKAANNNLSTRSYTVNGVSFKMIAVEGGTFKMGTTAGLQNPFCDAKPDHDVTLSNYCMGETEVTQALWQAVMGNNPSHFSGSNNPVENVSYNDCITFINKLNTLLSGQLPSGRKFRLPTEAEWEYAARGGNRSRGSLYSGSSNPDSVAWYKDNSGRETHQVKQKQANELGLYDMSGNVSEWCNDRRGSYSSSSQTNPKGPLSGRYRVLRGGNWYDYEPYCRVAERNYAHPDNRHNHHGLRLAL